MLANLPAGTQADRQSADGFRCTHNKNNTSETFGVPLQCTSSQTRPVCWCSVHPGPGATMIRVNVTQPYPTLNRRPVNRLRMMVRASTNMVGCSRCSRERTLTVNFVSVGKSTSKLLWTLEKKQNMDETKRQRTTNNRMWGA